MTEFDYVVIGAGSAGCVLAERLSADGANQVLVLEAGGSDRRFWIKTPIGYGRSFYNPKVNWMFDTEPDPQTGGRSSYWPRGKVLGGSSSINAMVYFRGLPTDFEDWQAAGAQGWGWDEVRKHYEAIECWVAPDGSQRGSGPLYISDVREQMHPCNHNYFAIARELGLPITDDCNGDQPEGVTTYRINTFRGRRWSGADAFLRPALTRRNVHLLTSALVQRVIVKNGRAQGVSVMLPAGAQTFHARKEVILSAGAVNSPKLLQLSGIGPGELLQRMGIEVQRDNPQVGANLQDHLGINYYYKASEPTLNDQLSPWWGKLWQGARYLLTRRGPLSLSINQSGGFVRSRPGLERPDQQLYLNPVTYTNAPDGRRRTINPDAFSGFILSFQPTRPTSRGRIEIASPDPAADPRIFPNYLSTQKDIDDVLAGTRLIQRMARTQAMRRFASAAIAPDIEQMDDEAMVEDFRQRCGTVFHPVSTCTMGRDESSAVVSPDLKVFGVSGLRVIDASVFPNVTSGNTHAPTTMLAHRASAIILRDGGPQSA